MIGTTGTTTTWYRSLSESVSALGAAAREYRLALQMAKLGVSHTDPSRTHICTGELTAPGALFERPHLLALASVRDLYADLEEQLRSRYENAALAYAHGAAWAIRTVLDGGQPEHVQLGSEHGRYALDGELPNLGAELARWTGGKRLHRLREDVVHREGARRVADSLGAQQGLEDHEFAALAAALDSADSLAQSAYDYGELAESALHFAIDRARTNRLPKDAR